MLTEYKPTEITQFQTDEGQQTHKSSFLVWDNKRGQVLLENVVVFQLHSNLFGTLHLSALTSTPIQAEVSSVTLSQEDWQHTDSYTLVENIQYSPGCEALQETEALYNEIQVREDRYAAYEAIRPTYEEWAELTNQVQSELQQRLFILLPLIQDFIIACNWS